MSELQNASDCLLQDRRAGHWPVDDQAAPGRRAGRRRCARVPSGRGAASASAAISRASFAFASRPANERGGEGVEVACPALGSRRSAAVAARRAAARSAHHFHGLIRTTRAREERRAALAATHPTAPAQQSRPTPARRRAPRPRASLPRRRARGCARVAGSTVNSADRARNAAAAAQTAARLCPPGRTLQLCCDIVVGV